jgi:hypothetical protein
MILWFTIDHLRASRVAATLLFAKYAREVAKALPGDQAYALRDSEVGWHFETEPSVGCPSTAIVYVANGDMRCDRGLARPPFSFHGTITWAEPDLLLLNFFQHVSTSTILARTLWTISARRSVKRKAGGRYAADLVLQLAVRRPVPLP